MGKLKQRYIGHAATQDWAGWECDCGERFAKFDDWKRHADEIAEKSETVYLDGKVLRREGTTHDC